MGPIWNPKAGRKTQSLYTTRVRNLPNYIHDEEQMTRSAHYAASSSYFLNGPYMEPKGRPKNTEPLHDESTKPSELYPRRGTDDEKCTLCSFKQLFLEWALYGTQRQAEKHRAFTRRVYETFRTISTTRNR